MTTTRLSSGYQSDDGDYKNKKKTYSREDFKEIYCINEKSLESLEKSRSTGFLFLGCLSSYQDSPCRYHHPNNHSSNIFTSCVSSKDHSHPHRYSHEDLLFQQQPRGYHHQPLYAQTSSTSSVVRPRSVAGGEALVYSRESLYNEARRWVWSEQGMLEMTSGLKFPVDFHANELDRYIELDPSTTTPHPLPRKPPASRYPSAPLTQQQQHQIKHVSFYHPSTSEYLFTRSATSGSFDQEKMRRARWEVGSSMMGGMGGGVPSVSQERLIDIPPAPPTVPLLQPYLEDQQKLSKQPSIASLTTKSASTQTDSFIRAVGGPSEYLSLSPRVTQRTRMISQPTQTNGLVTPTKPTIEPTKPPPPPPEPQTEEEFHENFFPYVNSTTTSLKTVISRSPSNKSDLMTSSEGSYSLDKPDLEEELFIIKPPEEFCDTDKPRNKKPKKRPSSIRAKSEERYKCDAATQSSITLSLHDLSSYEDDDGGTYIEAYERGAWFKISKEEELKTWMRHEDGKDELDDVTDGERDFARKYTALTHRMVHRRASGECYRRLGGNWLEINKRLTLSREDITSSSEYGFRIHGSRPVVVSAIESSSPAELAGLEVGDVIMTINGLSVLDSSHSDVVRIASGAEVLELELARTKDVVENEQVVMEMEAVIWEGKLMKFNGMDLESGGGNDDDDQDGGVKGVWVERTITLTQLHLYYTKLSSPPLKILHLSKPTKLTSTLSPNGILTLTRGHTPLLLLTGAPNLLQSLHSSIVTMATEDSWTNMTSNNMGLTGEELMGLGGVDCAGWVWKLGRRVKSWGRKWVVLREGVVYFFGADKGELPFGAVHLHGYRVQTITILGGRRFAFELIPPELGMRVYYFAVDSENERKRWLACLEYSIDRWINLNCNKF